MAKSKMVEQADYIPEDEKVGFSDLQVMQSGAGYYIGTIYTDPKDGFTEPGSRDSDYCATREEAEKLLARMQLDLTMPGEVRLIP